MPAAAGIPLLLLLAPFLLLIPARTLVVVVSASVPPCAGVRNDITPAEERLRLLRSLPCGGLSLPLLGLLGALFLINEDHSREAEDPPVVLCSEQQCGHSTQQNICSHRNIGGAVCYFHPYHDVYISVS